MTSIADLFIALRFFSRLPVPATRREIDAGAAGFSHAVAMVPLVQPVSVVYDQLGSLPVGRANRPVFSWYGDMDLASHFIRLARWRGMRATILLHPVLDPSEFASRKALSQAAWSVIAEGAASLRQNQLS